MINNIVLFRNRRLSVSYHRPCGEPSHPLEKTYPKCNNGADSRNSNEGIRITQSLLDDVEEQFAFTYGDLARKAVKVYMYEEEISRSFVHQTSSGRLNPSFCEIERFQTNLLGISIIGLHCLQTGITHYNEELLPHYPTRLFVSNEYSMVRRYSLVVSGSINQLSDSMLGSIFLQFGRYDIKLLNALMRLNRRYQRIFSSDEIWGEVAYPSGPWNLSIGSEGNEMLLWELLRKEHGISILSTNKLRWYSHNFSRLKNFYGNVVNCSTSSFLIQSDMDCPISSTLYAMDIKTSTSSTGSYVNSMLYKVGGAIYNSVRCAVNFGATAGAAGAPSGGNNENSVNVVIIIGLPGQQLSSIIMQQLHYIVPTSATKFHHDRCCRPLLPNGRRLAREESPYDSRTRRTHIIDPGTLFECSHDCNIFFKRIGDPRLTFLQFDGPPLNRINTSNCLKFIASSPLSHQHTDHCKVEESIRSSWTQLSENALAFIIAVEYDAFLEDLMASQLRQLLLHHIMYHCGSGYRRNEPLLIFVGIRVTTVRENEQEVMQAVEFIRSIMERAITTAGGETFPLETSLSKSTTSNMLLFDESNYMDQESLVLDMNLIVNNPQFSWRIQPISVSEGESSLKKGFFAGINWLTKTINRYLDKHN